VSIWIIAILLLTFGLSAAAAGRRSLKCEHDIMLALRNSANPSLPIGPAWCREAVRDVTSLGSDIVLATVVAAISIYYFLMNRPGAAWLLLVAVLSCFALNNILKLGHGRPRPPSAIDRFYTTSFPSGHAAMSAVVYLTICISLARAHPAFAPYFFAFAAVLTLGVGLSRIYLGFHYPTDVVAGWSLGAAWSLICSQAASWLHLGF
jgi:undecaprenyl-diphosphatase